MPLPLVAAGALAMRVAPYVMALAPMISDFFSGKKNDAAAADQIKNARDGLAARISQSEGIPLAQAQAAVDEHLRPLVEQHAQDAAGNAGHMVSDALGTVGGVMIGRGMAKGGGAGALEKSIVNDVAPEAEESINYAKPSAGVAPAAEEAVESFAKPQMGPAGDNTPEGPYTARAKAMDDMAAQAQTGAMDKVSGNGGFGGYIGQDPQAQLMRHMMQQAMLAKLSGLRRA